ncbi:GNAT family N-acetyltransferase [Actinomycetes bacterium KLBMP 9797]
MVDDLLLARAREAWSGLAYAPVNFPAEGRVEVVVSAGSALCPPGWAGIVTLGPATIATAPTERLAAALRAALTDLPVAARTDPDLLRTRLAATDVTDVLGPAQLAFLDEPDFRPPPNTAVETIPRDDDAIATLLAATPPADAEESGLDEITSAAFTVRGAAAGYRRWPGQVAHLCVLTAPEWRGRGLARVVAAAAVADALRHGLLPQWRARPEPSRRVARALGFRTLGAQLSIRCIAAHDQGVAPRGCKPGGARPLVSRQRRPGSGRPPRRSTAGRDALIMKGWVSAA